jgi:hypothetical protein
MEHGCVPGNLALTEPCSRRRATSVCRYFVALVVVLITACGRELHTGRDADVVIPAQPSWVWGKRSVINRYTAHETSGNPSLHFQVQQAIEGALARKGWKQVKSGSRAHVTVSYQIRSDFSDQPEFYTAYETGGEQALAGSFLIVIHERASGKVAWLGLYDKDGWDNSRGRRSIQHVVDEMLDDLK